MAHITESSLGILDLFFVFSYPQNIAQQREYLTKSLYFCLIGKEDFSREIWCADGSIVTTQFSRQTVLCVYAPRIGSEIAAVMKTKVNSKQTVFIRLWS